MLSALAAHLHARASPPSPRADAVGRAQRSGGAAQRGQRLNVRRLPVVSREATRGRARARQLRGARVRRAALRRRIGTQIFKVLCFETPKIPSPSAPTATEARASPAVYHDNLKTWRVRLDSYLPPLKKKS